MCSLTILPKILIIEVLDKLKTTPLIRMRLTCSMVNNIVEVNKRKFASRPLVGMDLEIFLRKDSIVCSGNSYFKYARGCTKQIEDQLSGVSFKSIKVFGKRKNGYYSDLIQFFINLKPICYEFESKVIPTRIAVALTDPLTITGPEMIVIENDSGADTDSFLRDLRQEKNRFKLHLKCQNSLVTGDLFEKIKHFGGADISTTLDTFYKLIWDIYNCTETLKVQDMTFRVNIDEDFSLERHISALPPCKTCADLTEASKTYLADYHPPNIRMIKLPAAKVALIVEMFDNPAAIHVAIASKEQLLEMDIDEPFAEIEAELLRTASST